MTQVIQATRILDIDQDTLKRVITIYPNQGIGNVRFGMNPAEVLANFPEEQTYEDWMGGNLNDAFLFHGIIFLFDKHNSIGPSPDSKMDQFVVQGRDDVHLWELPLNLWTIETVTGHLEENGLRFSSNEISLENRLRSHTTAVLRIVVEPHSLSLTFTEEGNLLQVSG